jgi:hypothetical protein
VIGFIAFGFADFLFEGRDVSTLGASAVIMILTNIRAWPKVLEYIQSLPKFEDISDEK